MILDNIKMRSQSRAHWEDEGGPITGLNVSEGSLFYRGLATVSANETDETVRPFSRPAALLYNRPFVSVRWNRYTQ